MGRVKMRISPTDTVRAIGIGEKKLIRDKVISQNTVRAVVSRVQKEGFGRYECHRVMGGVEVMRLG